MKSLTTPDFWLTYSQLSDDIQRRTKKAYQLWKENNFHASLHFKKVAKNIWSVRITQDYRALAFKEGDDYYWFWIGSHDEYEKLIK